MSTSVMSELKYMKFNLRKGTILASCNLKTTYYLEGSSRKCKNCNSYNPFKIRIKQWIPDECPCTLYKTDVQHLSFL